MSMYVFILRPSMFCHSRGSFLQFMLCLKCHLTLVNAVYEKRRLHMLLYKQLVTVTESLPTCSLAAGSVVLKSHIMLAVWGGDVTHSRQEARRHSNTLPPPRLHCYTQLRLVRWLAWRVPPLNHAAGINNLQSPTRTWSSLSHQERPEREQLGSKKP